MTPRLLELEDIRADLPVAWARTLEETVESELDLLPGHPGLIDPGCVGDDVPYVPGDLVIAWHQRASRGMPVFSIEDCDLEVISEADYAERVARMNRGESPI